MAENESATWCHRRLGTAEIPRALPSRRRVSRKPARGRSCAAARSWRDVFFAEPTRTRLSFSSQRCIDSVEASSRQPTRRTRAGPEVARRHRARGRRQLCGHPRRPTPSGRAARVAALRARARDQRRDGAHEHPTRDAVRPLHALEGEGAPRGARGHLVRRSALFAHDPPRSATRSARFGAKHRDDAVSGFNCPTTCCIACAATSACRRRHR
jgi:hypothetical protein